MPSKEDSLLAKYPEKYTIKVKNLEVLISCQPSSGLQQFEFTTNIIIVGINMKSYGFVNFRTLKNNLAIDFTRKKRLECIGITVMMLYLA